MLISYVQNLINIYEKRNENKNQCQPLLERFRGNKLHVREVLKFYLDEDMQNLVRISEF